MKKHFYRIVCQNVAVSPCVSNDLSVCSRRIKSYTLTTEAVDQTEVSQRLDNTQLYCSSHG